MKFKKMADSLYLINLDQKITGFREFISCWLYKSDKICFIVDPGPTATIPVLLQGLKELGVEKLHFILLTHIHIDHAGGAGLVAEAFPEAEVVCHEKGIAHMVSPEKLWQGSLKVLGNVAEAYGKIAAVSENRIHYPKNIVFNGLNIKIYETPGHASHHISFLFNGFLFAGEVAGVNVEISNGTPYLRIATPPKFIYEVYKHSLDLAAQIECDAVCFGHNGLRKDVGAHFSRAKAQLELWLAICKEAVSKGEQSETAIFETILKNDPSMQAYHHFKRDIQERERYFSMNSIRGMLGYLQA